MTIKTPRIGYFTERIDFTLPKPGLTTTWIQEAIQQEGHELVQLNFIFCADAYLLAQNLQYLQHNTLTDVITFNYAEAAREVEGDIYISIERVSENAAIYQQTLIQELYTVMIHGVLHLLGYQDIDAAERAQMREKEIIYVAARLAK